jgi:chitodextrinase
MVKLAHFKRLAFLSPFWSGYFRGYINYSDSTRDLPPAELNALAQERQVANMLKGAFSATALAYKSAIVDPADVTPPTTPSNLIAQFLTPTSVVLTWSPSDDNVGSAVYVVSRDGVARARTGVPNFLDSGLDEARDYVYQVVAFDTSFNASAPASVTVTTPDVTPPSIPTNLAVVANLAGSQIDIVLSWAPSTDNVAVTNYLVYRGMSPDSLSLVGTSASNSFTIVNAQPETTFYFAVSAVDAVRHASAQSEPAGVATPAIPDITAPIVNIGYPADGARVSGSTYLYAAAYDVRGGTFDVPSGPAGVQFEIDGITVGPEQTVRYSGTDEYSVYRLTWDTRKADEGNHVITAVVRDHAGNVARSAGVTVRVDNR